MPEEIVVIVLVSVIAGTLMVTTIVGSIFKYLRERNRSQATPGDSLTTSELKALMAEAVAEATASLHTRIDTLEDRLDARLLELPPAGRIEIDDEATPEAAPRRRAERPIR